MENTVENKACATCGKKKSLLECGPCHDPICKSCANFLVEGTFSLMKTVPAELQHTVYCYSCHLTHVEGPLAHYNDLVKQAKEIMVFDKTQGKETRFIRRNEDWIEVKDCEDKEEVLMKLAFHAVEMGCNAVIEVDITAQKIRLGAYQTQLFKGTGRPALVKENQLVKDRSIWHFPN